MGYFILNLDFLISFWTSLYNTPVIVLTKFNNTIVMGSLALSIILFAPVYLLSNKFIAYYRLHWRDRVAKWKIVRLLTVSSLSYKILK
jgi:uncharacterized protein (TIGR03546 family)